MYNHLDNIDHFSGKAKICKKSNTNYTLEPKLGGGAIPITHIYLNMEVDFEGLTYLHKKC